MACIPVLNSHEQSFVSADRRFNSYCNAERGSIMSFRMSPIMLVVMVVLMAMPCWAADIYVDSDSPGPHTGLTWNNAYVYLQDALVVAQYGDTIKVAQGHYWPDQATGAHTTGRNATFQLKPGVKVLGGFAGYTVALPSWQFNDRNVQLYQTVLTGDINANDYATDPNVFSEMAMLLTQANRQENCYTVVNASNTDANSVLDGFTITGGNANDNAALSPFMTSRGGGISSNMGFANIKACTIAYCSALQGGGLYSIDSDPNVTDCTFLANFANAQGGAMWYEASHIRLIKTGFKQNTGGSYAKGGAIYAADSNSVIDGCDFTQNYGRQGGGAIYYDGGDPNIANSLFYENSAFSAEGGAINFASDCNATVTNTRFIGNQTNNSGGAVRTFYTVARFVDCMFIRNSSRANGGAVYNRSSEPNFVNCLFNGNYADSYGGAVSNVDVLSDMINCTFASNKGDGGGNALATNSLSTVPTRSIIKIANSILWDNGAEIFNIDGSTISVTYSTLYNQWPGQGNNRVNPFFVNIRGEDNKAGNEDDNLMLQPNSPSVDSGNNYEVPEDILKDLSHVPRFMDNEDVSDTGRSDGRYVVDRGAYEYGDPNSLNPPTANAGVDQNVPASFDGKATVVLDGSGSEDPDDDSLQYRWTWNVSGQAKQASGVHPSITLPIGQHVIQLIVSDGLTDSEADFVIITVISTGGRPTANAGPDQTVILPTGSIGTVLLNGSGSLDPDSDPLQYTWTWVADGQPGQTSTANPIIQLPLGQHTIQLVVFDGTYYSDADTVILRVSRPNQDPVANAGPDQTVSSSAGQANVTLDGSGSYDPDGTVEQYTWTWTSGGQARTATGVNPTVLLPAGQYSVRLVVSDGTASSQADFVFITVLQSNELPVANAGPDQTVPLVSSSSQASVTLNGSGSYDTDGTISQYFWTWTSGGQQKSATGVSPTFLLPAGQYSVKLIVYDGEDYSQADYVQITVTQSNQSPVANAGPDQTKTVTAGGQVSVTLNGSGSTDPDGTITNYYWSWVVNGQSRNATGVMPTISLPEGQFTIQLVVHDGQVYSQADTAVIMVTQSNQPPVANAGPDQTKTVTAGSQASVTLNGTGSTDPDGSITNYYWSWIVNGQSRNATGVMPTISLPEGQFTIQLVVHDGQIYSQADTVVITVTETNQPPVANAGPDQTKTVTAGSQSSVTLNGTGSTDPDGSITNYYWSWIVNGQSRNATGATPMISLPKGQFTIQLVVHDGQIYSQADTVVITITETNQPPVANAGPDQTKTVTTGSQSSVTLNGSGSTDPDGTITNYYWSWIVNGQSRNATGATPTIALPVGQFTIQLVVHDGQIYSQADTVVITMTQSNQAPVANAGPDQVKTIASGSQTTVNLNGTGSYDPDGTITNYYWTYVVNGQSRNVAGAIPAISLPAGQHTIQLIVTDGQANSQPDTVVITVNQANQAPVANAGPDQVRTVTAGHQASIVLNGTASYDPDGTITNYTWNWVVNGQSRSTTGATPTISLPVGQYTIQLIVSDGQVNSSADTMVITVTQTNQPPVANAGPDQTKAVTAGNQASVTLNGSASYDPDGIVTQYFWSWLANGQSRQATGVNPTIALGVGQYTVQLIVFDGLVYSQSDTVVVTVTQANQAPVANAGADQSVNSTSGSLASVTLDGSGSYDFDGTVTQYLWAWTLNGQPYQVTGIAPIVLLPVGQHTVTLVVSDGLLTSAADQVVITVTQSAQASVDIFSGPITANDGQLFVNAWVTLPYTVSSTVDTSVPMSLYPGGVQSSQQYAWQIGDDTMILVLFNETAVLAAIPFNGSVELSVYGQFVSGQQFYGSDSVTISH